MHCGAGTFSRLLPALRPAVRANYGLLGRGVPLRPAARGFRATALLGNRQSSGNLSDAEGFGSEGRHVIGALVVNEAGVLAPSRPQAQIAGLEESGAARTRAPQSAWDQRGRKVALADRQSA